MRADLLVVDAVGVGVEGRQRPHRGHEHPHRVGVVAEALHEVLDVLVHERVDRDLVHPLLQLGARGQRAVDDQVGDLQVARVLAQLLDRVAAVLEDAGVAVDVGDRAATRRGVRVRGVVGHQPEVLVVGLDLPEVHRAHRAVLDRQLVALARAVVGHRERLVGVRHHAVVQCAEASRSRARMRARRRRREVAAVQGRGLACAWQVEIRPRPRR